MKTQPLYFKAVPAILILLLFALNGIAQNQQRHDGPPPFPTQEQIDKRIAHMSKNLNLTKDQEVKIAELFQAHYEELKAKREQEKPEIEQHRKEMEAFRNDFEQEVKSVLSTEQQLKFDSLKEQRREGGKNNRRAVPE